MYKLSVLVNLQAERLANVFSNQIAACLLVYEHGKRVLNIES